MLREARESRGPRRSDFPGVSLRVLPGKAFSDQNFGQAAELEAHGVSAFLTLTLRSVSQSLPHPAPTSPSSPDIYCSVFAPFWFSSPHCYCFFPFVSFFLPLGNKSKPQTTKHPLWLSACTTAIISTVQTQTWDT